MSAASLAQEIERMPVDEPLDWPDFSARLDAEFLAAQDFEERGDLLAVRAVAMEIVVRQLELVHEQFEKFIDACELDYKRLIVQEARVDGQLSYEQMRLVTDREIAAGRMSDDYALRVIALEETQGTADAGAAPAQDSPAEASGRFARLKHWLHID